MRAYYYDNIECDPFLSLPPLLENELFQDHRTDDERFPPLSVSLSIFSYRGDQRLPHDSGEDVTPERLAELGLIYLAIPIEGREREDWEKDIGELRVSFLLVRRGLLPSPRSEEAPGSPSSIV